MPASKIVMGYVHEALLLIMNVVGNADFVSVSLTPGHHKALPVSTV